MSDGEKPVVPRRHEMLAVSRAYYLDDKSKLQIAQEMGMSRFRVARLLAEARDLGLVTITVNGGGIMPELSEAIRKHLGLRHAVVIEAYGDTVQVRNAVGVAAGNYLNETLRAGEMVGIAWGRTLTAMIESLVYLPPVDILQLTGSIGLDLQNSAIELVRKATLTTGRSARAFFAPFFVDDVRTAASLRRQPEIAQLLSLFDNMTTAVVAVGSLTPRITQTLDILPAHVQDLLIQRGAQAEICGIPLDSDGNVVDPVFLRHCLNVSADQLRATKRVIAAVSGPPKAQAVLSVSRSGMINEIVMDGELAQAVLQLPAINPAEQRPRLQGAH